MAGSIRASRGWTEGLFGSLLSLVLCPTLFSAPHALTGWRQLPPLPDACGFASPFVGVVDGALLVAGGANFPDVPLWEGGRKVWHDGVFLLERDAPRWERAAELPGPLAYGVAVTTNDGVLCIGGSDTRKHHAAVFLLRRRNRKIEIQALPSLPLPVAMAAGARVGNIVYLAGGLAAPDALDPLTTFFSLDLRRPEAGWRSLPSWPGPGRSQAVAGVLGEDFYLFSGLRHETDTAGKRTLVYLRDAYRYTPGRGWLELADLPHAAAAAASPVPTDGNDLLVIGGVDGTGVGTVPLDFHHVPRRIQRYSPKSDTWSPGGNAPVGRVCVSVTHWNGRWILPTGERSAGVRSPEVWTLRGTERRSSIARGMDTGRNATKMSAPRGPAGRNQSATFHAIRQTAHA